MKKLIVKGVAWSAAADQVWIFVLIVLLFFSAMATGCFVSFEDASLNPRYASIVGKEFRASGPVAIHGITMEKNYAPILDHYIVTTFPGIGGREVLSQGELVVGTTVRVRKVMRCVDCYLDFAPRVHAVVDITSSDKYRDAPVQVDLGLLLGAEPGRAFVGVDR